MLKAKLRPWIPLFVSLGLALLALLIHLLSALSAPFALFFNTRISAPVRLVLAHISALYPLSIAETVILLSPALVVLLILLARRASKDGVRAAQMLSWLLSVPILLYALFVFTFATGYYTPPLAERLALSEKEPDAESLYDLALTLVERADACAQEAEVAVLPQGSRMPFDYKGMNLRLISAYDKVAETHGFLTNYPIATKPVLLSDAMAYTNITGVYTFMTGEMNVCVALPDFSTVFTAAHEMAHARGIAREDEANFTAFLVCEASSDPYVRYAGYVNLLQYVLVALYDTDVMLYRTVWEKMSDTVKEEIRAYNRVLRSYEGSIASDIAGSINDAYLGSMGTEGTVSYGLVVRLAVRYFD